MYDSIDIFFSDYGKIVWLATVVAAIEYASQVIDEEKIILRT